MNYIHQLQTENTNLRNQLNKINTDVTNLLHYLQSEKFVGFESDGSRKDLVCTGDMVNILREIRMETLV